MNLLKIIFEHLIESPARAFFYAGILSGMFVFPIFAVVKLRRRVHQEMSSVLEEILERDPWLISVSAAGMTFDIRKAAVWLQDLCAWYAKYAGIQRFFGAPALDAMCAEVTNELLNVYLSWASEIQKLAPAEKKPITELLGRLKRYTDTPEIDQLLHVLGSADDPLAWYEPIKAKVDKVSNWKSLARELGLPEDTDPYDAGMTVKGVRTELALPMAVLTDENLSFREDLSTFLLALNGRFPRDLRVMACHLDQAFPKGVCVVVELKRILEGDTASVPARVRNHPEWRQYVASFGRTPLASLKASPNDRLRAIRKAFSRRMEEVYSTSPAGKRRNHQAQAADQAWQVMLILNTQGLWK